MVTVTSPNFFNASPIFDESPTTTIAEEPGAMYFFATASTCDNFGSIFSSGRVYFVMNNVFNDASGSQCITASGTGFTVTSANHTIATNGPPAAYTAFVRGCHFGNCTTGSNLPKLVSSITGVPSSFSVSPFDSFMPSS